MPADRPDTRNVLPEITADMLVGVLDVPYECGLCHRQFYTQEALRWHWIEEEIDAG